jgi:hypothetical protein
MMKNVQWNIKCSSSCTSRRRNRASGHATVPANVEDLVLVLPKWELRAQKNQQFRVHVMDSAACFTNFVDQRLDYTTTLVANSERLVLPKPIPNAEGADMNVEVLEGGTPELWLCNVTGDQWRRRSCVSHLVGP